MIEPAEINSQDSQRAGNMSQSHQPEQEDTLLQATGGSQKGVPPEGAHVCPPHEPSLLPGLKGTISPAHRLSVL